MISQSRTLSLHHSTQNLPCSFLVSVFIPPFVFSLTILFTCPFPVCANLYSNVTTSEIIIHHLSKINISIHHALLLFFQFIYLFLTSVCLCLLQYKHQISLLFTRICRIGDLCKTWGLLVTEKMFSLNTLLQFQFSYV